MEFSIANLDRRWLFLAIAIVVIVPVILKPDVAPEPDQSPKKVFEAIDALPDGAVVLLSADYDPGSEAEIYPMNEAILAHLGRKNIRLVITQLWPQAGPLVRKALDRAYPKEKREGIDYVNLGYKTGGQVVILKMNQSIRDAFPEDVNGTPVDRIPAMEGIRRFADIDLFVILSAGTPGTKEWVQNCQSITGKPMVSGVTAVSAPDFFAYVNSGQLVGLLGGLRGASDYEKLLARPGRGMAGMGAQTFGHFLIVVFIILGNIGYFMVRRRATRRGA